MNPNGTSGSTAHHRHPSPRQRFFGILRPERRDIEVLLLFSLMNGVLLIAQPMAVDAVVNNIAFGGEQKVYLQALIIIAIALGMLLGVSALTRGTQAYVMETIERRLFVRMAADLSYRLPHSRIGDFERTLGPEMINRFFEVVTLQKLSSTLLLEGVNEDDNVPVKHVGTPRTFDFTPLDHVALLEKHDLVELERGARVAGHRKGDPGCARRRGCEKARRRRSREPTRTIS